jgi:hypothetical protein
MELIIFIVIIAFILNAGKKTDANAKSRNTEEPNVWDQNSYQKPRQTQQQSSQWQKLAQENIERARQRATKVLQEFETELVNELSGNTTKKEETAPKNRTAMQQMQASRMEARNTTIVERAKANTEANKADVTLETMEAEHAHSERVAAATHHHPEDIIPENMLGNIEDLMVKGYDGNLCFERDFVGEGLDMISHFTVPSDVPDYSNSAV